jgi:hypothetical protein
MVSSPGGDRGPAVGYRNHMNAFKHDNRFEIDELTEQMIHKSELLNSFDVIWAYVRFHPSIYNYFKSLNKTFIGGPNVLFERGDLGPTDDWEKSYCGLPNLDFHINNSSYYLEHVRKYLHPNTKTFTHEACYDLNDLPTFGRSVSRINDVLVYYKQRVNDELTPSILAEIENKLRSKNLSYKVLRYGSYNRSDFIDLLQTSRSCIWLSIEDYCSLAQIEAHLSGCPVVGTKYNLTIPVCEDAIVDAQDFDKWILWKNPEIVANEFMMGVERILSRDDIEKLSIDAALDRHSYEKYTQKFFDEVNKTKC